MLTTFVRRPVLSVVISILLVLLGLISLRRMPMALFPSVAPPEVNVTVEYTGANAETVTKAAIVPLERAINGVPGMKYMSSDAGNDGVGVVQILFETGTHPDVAAVNVQNRVNAVMGELPAEVIRNGVKIAKEENAMLMYLSIHSTNPDHDEKFLYNFADINVLAELKRINGVGYADILGAKEYAMRVWLKPDKMATYDVSTDDVLDALEESNVEAAPGKIGENSDKGTTPLQYTLKYTGKFNTVAAYEAIPIRAMADGRVLKIKDVADVEFGTTYFDVESKFNGRPAASIMLKQLPGSNAREVIEAVKLRLASIKEETFLPGMDYAFSYDVSRFLDASVHEVVKTLVEAFLLVAFVVFLFLQDFRATLIPVIAVPVSLVGTFVCIQFLGFSLNLITLFALVLAIGIVVDDAIVVVEAVHHKMTHTGLSARDATEQSLGEIGPAIIAITLVMGSVFIPLGFIDGPAGIFYRQFALTMAIAIALSGMVALTLTPALCASFLRPHEAHPRTALARFFGRFNRGYDKLEGGYAALVRRTAARRAVTFVLLGGFALSTGLVAKTVPQGFIPEEDQGVFYVSITSPPGATLEQTKEVVNAVAAAARDLEGVESISTLAGTNVLSDGTGAGYGTCLVNLKPWKQRTRSVRDVIKAMEQRASHIQAADLEFFPPPSVPGYGNASGFELRLLDKTGRGEFREMQGVVDQFIVDLKSRPEIASAFTIFNANYPQYTVNVDIDRAAQKGVSIERALGTLQTLLGSEYATNFIRFGQMYKVMVQALPAYRAAPEQLLRLQVRSDRGELVPLSAFMTMEKSYGVDQTTRLNMYPSAELNGDGKPGVSSGAVIKAIQETARDKLPRGYGIDWAGITRDEVNAGSQGLLVGLIALIFVYLVLAAQYESFILPASVVLSLPPGVFGAFGLLKLTGLENNIYTHIALVVLIGLLGKNAILIVEFAELRCREGLVPFDAVIEAARQRLRPILMTSLAFIVGLIPLATATGAGAVANRTIGSATVGGMVMGTLWGVVLVPGLYLACKGLAAKLSQPRLVLLALMITAPLGCAYTEPKVPEVELPASFDAKSTGSSAASMKWQDYFADENLNALVATALENNYDLRIALQRVEIARAGVRQSTGAVLPQVSLGVGAGVRKFGTYTMDGAGNATTDITPGRRVPMHYGDFVVGLQASWEIDVWGKLRSKRSAARAQYLATLEGTNLVITILVSEVALAYFELLALDDQQEILAQTVARQTQSLEIMRLQKEAGRANELSVQQLEGQLASTEAMVTATLWQRTETENQINLLLGRVPQPIVRSKDLLLRDVVARISLGIPSDLLRNRADIREAELQVQASKFDVAAARKAFYPSLTLSAGVGFQSFDPRFLFITPESLVYSAVGGLTAPLLNRSGLEAQLDASKAIQVQAMYNYQGVILRAFVEVENALVAVERTAEVVAQKKRQKAAVSGTVDTADALFRAGKATYLDVLLAQQNTLSAELELIDALLEQRFAGIGLYRALGGGSHPLTAIKPTQ